MIPLVGFLPADDDRVRSTVEAIERDLTEDGFVLRYRDRGHRRGGRAHRSRGGVPGVLVLDGRLLHLIGRYDDAHAAVERLLGLRNDLGLLAEEYDVRAKRQVGNFPQAFSHVSLVNAAYNLSGHTDMGEHFVDRPGSPASRSAGPRGGSVPAPIERLAPQHGGAGPPPTRGARESAAGTNGRHQRRPRRRRRR